MRRLWVLVGSALSASAPALAEGAPELGWVGPECSSFAPAFQEKLVASLAPEERAKLSGAVSVERRGEKLEVALELALSGTPLGARRIEVKSCSAAVDTAAVAASLAVFSATETPPEPKPQAVSAPVLAPSAAPPPAPRREPPVPPRPSLDPYAGVLLAVDVGALPDLAPGAALELGLGFGRFSAGLLGAVSLAERYDVDAAGRVRLQLWSATVRGCYAVYGWRQLRADTCAGARLLNMRGRGEGFDVDREGSLVAWAPLLGLDLALRAPAPLEWRLELDGSAPLSRQRFVVRSREVARLEPLTLGARLGALVRF